MRNVIPVIAAALLATGCSDGAEPTPGNEANEMAVANAGDAIL